MTAPATQGFLTDEEQALGTRFLEAGHVVLPAEAPERLEEMRGFVAELAAKQLGRAEPNDIDAFLNGIHEEVEVAALNDLRLAVIRGMNAAPWFREAYFSLARGAIESLVGNELAMQLRVNLSIQMPDDESSILPLHADVWSGDSPFEVVLWVPLVSCYATKSMFLLPPEQDRAMQARLSEFAGQDVDALYRAVEPDLTWLEVRYGEVLLFTQNLMHGNRVNREPETRWSMNCRFKSLFSPYADKKLGEFFEPVTLRPASRLGLGYALPGGFDE